MTFRIIKAVLVVMIPASMFLVACNNDDDNGGGGATGSVNFDVSGDLSGSKDGQAALLESSIGSIFFLSMTLIHRLIA